MTHLERVTAIGLAVNHIKNFLLDFFALRIARCPIVSCAAALGVNEEVFWVVDVSVRSVLDAMDYLVLSIN